jgi:hypothetical protein
MSPKRLLAAFLFVTCFGEVANAGFIEVGTAFGPQTGLEDVSTGLVWLASISTPNNSVNTNGVFGDEVTTHAN